MHPLTPDWYRPRSELKKIDNISAIIGTGVDNIKVIENFISDEECATAMKIISNLPVNFEATHSYPIHTHKDYRGPYENEKAFGIMMGKRMVETAEKLYGLTLVRDQMFLYIVHPKGTYIDPHTDILDIDNPDYENDTYESQLERFPYLWSGHLSILTYLNDEYEGGELYFPELDYAIRPKKGMIIMFPGNLHYVHGVASITEGVRYTLSQWSKFVDFKPRG
jgi:hypothetical protein